MGRLKPEVTVHQRQLALPDGSLWTYDYRIIEHVAGEEGQPDRYDIDYSETTRFYAKPSLLNLFEDERTNGNHDFTINVTEVQATGLRFMNNSSTHR